MSKSWILLIVIAVITMLVVGGFEFYQSISGTNIEFQKRVVNLQISSSLGTDVLDSVRVLDQGFFVRDGELDDNFQSEIVDPEILEQEVLF
ncbi:MAG: hypothetical protein QY330_02990 [Candidatus Dojkabacteria bacterium]|uniref:Uncharacterized protein n=2 Tax=Candidatus Dojkabacteria TaxID=74243 RepID=A0A136KHM9_9BACT|nr:MAG: hypothetical protein UZ20_WS6002000657 [candidate division WS6 bacterium OLB21]MBW7953941.1 hypothetical protein [Candidatus Dojkabacteria bacterium]WKZ27488.1 MAG: hypothetical protein QY330_02990 [Candidatus Dojkabacteria bacterium]